MKTHRWPLVALLLLLAACAAGGKRSLTGAEVILEVRNDLIPRSSVTVTAVSPRGRTILGSVPPGQTRELRFRQPAFPGQYRFIADPGAGQAVASTETTLAPGERLVWSLRLNSLVTVEE